MSRTKKTDPYWVQMSDPKKYGITLYENHDHADGECDLPDMPEDQHHGTYTKCSYGAQQDGKNRFCGCDLCTAQSWRKINNKRERRVSNRRRLEFVVDTDYYDDMDDPYNKDEFW